MPKTAMMAASMRPAGVTGTVSPYPTVVNVTIPHHIAAGMLEKLSGWARFSAKYINDDVITSTTSIETTAVSN